MLVFVFQKYFWKNLKFFYFFLLQINIFLVFLDQIKQALNLLITPMNKELKNSALKMKLLYSTLHYLS
jgi:hypothetical protein